MDWQPIETAPKDERILVYTDRGCTALVEWKAGPDDEREWRDGYWQAVVDECFATFLQGDEILNWVIDPTHWMPLPAPPAKIEKAA